MGKKKGRTFKVQKAPPHRGAVILTDKQLHRLQLMTAVGMLAGMAAEIAPNSRPVTRALADLSTQVARAIR